MFLQLVLIVISVLPSILKACRPCKPSPQIFLWYEKGKRPKPLMWPQATPKPCTSLLELFLGRTLVMMMIVMSLNVLLSYFILDDKILMVPHVGGGGGHTIIIVAIAVGQFIFVKQFWGNSHRSHSFSCSEFAVYAKTYNLRTKRKWWMIAHERVCITQIYAMISYTSVQLSVYRALPRAEWIFRVFEGSFLKAPWYGRR